MPDFTPPELDEFTKHYLIAALWADGPDNGMHYDLSDIAPKSIGQAAIDCARFQYQNKDNLAVAYEEYDNLGFVSVHGDATTGEACAGHDFWLTRNHHGAGFWDRGLSIGATLTAACHTFHELSLYVGDDGKIYIE